MQWKAIEESEGDHKEEDNEANWKKKKRYVEDYKK